MANRLARCWAHLVHDHRRARRVFPDALLARIEALIGEGERTHAAELRLAIEAALPVHRIWRGCTPRQRAHEVFAELGVWDTAGNNGVLLYVLLADHAVEIVADRAATAAIPEQRWREVCDALVAAYRRGAFEPGTLDAVQRLGTLLAGAFPASGEGADELPNRPAIL